MDANQFFSFEPAKGPASPFANDAGSFHGSASGPQAPPSPAGSNSPTRQQLGNADPAASVHSQQSPSAAAAAVKAPWDDDDDDWNAPSPAAPAAAPQKSAPTSPFAPAQKEAPTAPAAKSATSVPPPSAATAPAAAAAAAAPNRAASQDSMSYSGGSPAEPHASPKSLPRGSTNDFPFASASQSTPQGSPQGLPNRPPTPPSKPAAADTAKMDALNKQIASRTTAFDAATKEKETKILAAAQEYIKSQKAKREGEVSEAKAKHKKEQQADASKIDAYKKSGAVWNAVGMLVDLQKPNQYSKGTEQMRSILTTLNSTPAKAATPAKA